MTGDRWWWPAGTIAAGRRLVEMPECGYSDIKPFTGKAEYFDRPRTPFTFSDPTVRHQSAPSILGFVASQPGEYVADVSVTGARLTVHNPDLEIGDNAQNLGGTWEVEYEAPAGDPGPTVTAQLRLGHLGQGLHDLPYRLVDLSTAPGEHFAITIRLAHDEQPPQTAPPAQPETAPSAPSPSPGIVVAGTRRSTRTISVTTTRATALVRRALRTRLSGWTVSRVACRRASDRRSTCTFAAGRRGFRLTGSGAVSARPTGAALGYRLTARISRTGCRPAGAERCGRRAIWSG